MVVLTCGALTGIMTITNELVRDTSSWDSADLQDQNPWEGAQETVLTNSNSYVSGV